MKAGNVTRTKGGMHRAATLRRISPEIRATRQDAWGVLGDITSMTAWAPGVIRVDIVTDGRKAAGVGATRIVVFDDGRSIRERVTSWDDGRGFSYAATDGLPLSLYAATLAIGEAPGGDRIQITWESSLEGKGMTEGEFAGLLAEMGRFYEASLANLKRLLEPGASCRE